MANMAPNGLNTTNSLLKNKIAQPAMVNTVAISHFLDGGFFKTKLSNNPAKIGALPIESTVPIATPVSRTDEKKQYWNTAKKAAVSNVFFHGQSANFNLRIRPKTINNIIPPIASLNMDTKNGSTVVGMNVCAVPVVPHNIAADKTIKKAHFSDNIITLS